MHVRTSEEPSGRNLGGRPGRGHGPCRSGHRRSGEELVRVSSAGLDLPAAFAYARERGGTTLRSLGYAQRAERLAATVKVLQANRDAYYGIATSNCGTVMNDSAVDIDGAIYTLGQYAEWGASLGEALATREFRRRALDAVPLAEPRVESGVRASGEGTDGRRLRSACGLLGAAHEPQRQRRSGTSSSGSRRLRGVRPPAADRARQSVRCRRDPSAAPLRAASSQRST